MKIHSFTDLITNSSTTIFTYSEGSEDALKEMINEIMKTFNVQITCDDMFDIAITSSSSVYEEYLENSDELPEGITNETDIYQLVEDVNAGKIPKPEWFEEAETTEDRWNSYLPTTTLHLIPKDVKYEKMAKLIKSFLYSTDHEATREG